MLTVGEKEKPTCSNKTEIDPERENELMKTIAGGMS